MERDLARHGEREANTPDRFRRYGPWGCAALMVAGLVLAGWLASR